MAEYQVYYRLPTGELMEVFRDFHKLEYGRKHNDVGFLRLDLRPDYDTSIFRDDARLEVWRQVGASAPYLDGESIFFLRSWGFATDENGREVIHLEAVDAVALLRDRIVAYPAGSSYASKTGDADNIMRAIVRENLGTLASDTARVVSGLTVQADGGALPSVTKAFAWRNVLAVLQELAEDAYQQGTYASFDVVYTGPASLEFRAYANARSQEHGKNSGNTIIFSREAGNLSSPILSYDGIDERNYVYVGGQGEESARQIVTRSSRRILASPYSRKELFVSATNSTTEDALYAEGRAAVFANRRRVSLSGYLRDTDSCQYGVHYRYGDRVVAQYRGAAMDAHVDAFAITVTESGAETLQIAVHGEAE